MNKESALLEFYGWIEPAQSYFEAAVSSNMSVYPKGALSYLQMAAEFAFKAAIVSIGGKPTRSRSPYVLSTRCRRLVPKLEVSAQLYSPSKRKLLSFLDPAFYAEAGKGARLPVASEWKQLVYLVKQLLRVMESLCRKRIDALFR